MEDLPVKAIVIGVSVFVTMAVVSALMIYFNTARGVADAVNKRTNIAEVYDNIMNDDVFIDTLTGVEIRSLITKYADYENSDNIFINIVSISGEDVTGSYNNIDKLWCRENGLISEQELDLINPVWKCTVEKVQNDDTVTLKLSLNVENQGDN